ncbi:DUF1471 domain-containing protein [Erwinia sp. PK3-005]|uniref:DUF1471 domain-containing protein n=1 Tax=Mixta hanseatica TaxID=2872648 RepID=A0ABY4R9Q6_9GAMM|nr:DUF1471 domain-containing protein [Mixta hanseatica]UQY45141.1 DUF1471 domain-containing protein [Mixta hanseatica]
MKNIKFFADFIGLSGLSFNSFAESITATALPLDAAEAKIVAQAQQQGATYKITEANFNKGVHMTAELMK